MLVTVGMPVHDRDRAPQARRVGGLDDFEPLAGLDLVRADHRADLVVEDLGRRTRQGAQPGRFQLAQEVGHGAAERLGTLPDFERREGMDVDAGDRFLDRPADRQIGRPGVFRVDAALQADLGGAALPGFLDPSPDLREVEVVGPAAQIFAELALREGAELTAEIADVGVVDVAGHDIADHVPIDPLAELVGRPAHRSAGRGASGLTWSGVTGDTPPQSLIPASIIWASPSRFRLGGAWMFISGPKISRATAIVHR